MTSMALSMVLGVGLGLLAGQFDFICDVPPDQIPGIEKNPKFEVLGSTIVNHRITVFDKNHPRLADPRIRQAFTHAIDRQAIVDALWLTTTTPASPGAEPKVNRSWGSATNGWASLPDTANRSLSSP